ncbi:hypothetical protein [Mucilaginibacter antarcticus]|uniref:hypothetical protein n=1 Tax=Mucilaginibacter antarcticus TaxID=1855725 RepID=UPI00363C8F72
MPFTYYKTPVGTCQITEEDGFITRVHILDEEHNPTEAETSLMKQVLTEFDEYFAGTRRTFTFPIKQGDLIFSNWFGRSCLTSTMVKPSLTVNNPT